MLMFLIKRLGVLALTALVMTFVVFFLTNRCPNLERPAKLQGSQRMSDAEVASHLKKNGYLEPIVQAVRRRLSIAVAEMGRAVDSTVAVPSC